MERYDYMEAVKADVLEYIEDNEIEVTTDNREEVEERLNEDLWTVDSVTGNASGSYTFSSWRAEEYVCHNLDLLGEALDEFGGNTDPLKDGAEACDVTIRCYLLGRAIAEVLDELIGGGGIAMKTGEHHTVTLMNAAAYEAFRDGHNSEKQVPIGLKA